MSKCIVLDPGVSMFVPSGNNGELRSPPATVTTQETETLIRKAVAEAEQKAAAELAAVRLQTAESLRKLEAELESYLSRLEEHLAVQAIELAIRCAEEILRRRMPDAEMLRNVLAEIFAKIVDYKAVKVRMHPADIALLGVAQQTAEEGSDGRLSYIADSSLKRGDIVVENGFGQFDASLDRRLDLLRERLAERYRQSDANTTHS